MGNVAARRLAIALVVIGFGEGFAMANILTQSNFHPPEQMVGLVYFAMILGFIAIVIGGVSWLLFR